jgi:hypothetical protein
VCLCDISSSADAEFTMARKLSSFRCCERKEREQKAITPKNV